MTTRTLINNEIKRLRREVDKVRCYADISNNSTLSYTWVRNFRDDKVENPTKKQLIELDNVLGRLL